MKIKIKTLFLYHTFAKLTFFCVFNTHSTYYTSIHNTIYTLLYKWFIFHDFSIIRYYMLCIFGMKMYLYNGLVVHIISIYLLWPRGKSWQMYIGITNISRVVPLRYYLRIRELFWSLLLRPRKSRKYENMTRIGK